MKHIQKAIEADQEAKTVADETRRTLDQTRDAVTRLQQSSRRLADIAAVMEDVAARASESTTDAAVQLTELGPEGKRFVFVVEAMRDVAEQSNLAARNLFLLVRTLRQEAEAGTRFVDQTEKTLHELLVQLRRLAETLVVKAVQVAAADRKQVATKEKSTAETTRDSVLWGWALPGTPSLKN